MKNIIKLNCKKCNINLPIIDFYRKSESKTGYESICKSCRSNKKPEQIINIDGEIWKDVLNYEGIYQVSNYGRVKSLERIDFSGFNRKEKMLKMSINKGYGFYTLNKEGNYKIFKSHRLVAFAFIPNPENKPEVNHIDGNKQNNAVYNLEWVTASENTQHAHKLGLVKVRKGSNHKHSKLTEAQVIEIRAIGKSKTLNEISLIYGVSFQTISGILLNKHWKHVT